MAARTYPSRWQQLGLELPLEPQFSREDFLISDSNADALRLIEAWPRWPDSVLLLIGERGSGKSHLAAIWAAQAGAEIFSGAALANADVAALTEKPALVIDAIDELGAAEAPLFHILNLARQGRRSLLLTAQRRPDLWGLKTPDLLSRLRLAPVVELGAPDDALLQSVLHKLFRDRQVLVDPAVIDFIALHIDRSLEVARAFVELIDRVALARGSAVTRSLARELLVDGTDESD
jgi:chromosomal replication initiation ATPase DnaA